MNITQASISKAAARHRARFEVIARAVPFEPDGILFSEALFLRAALDEWKPGRIVESGRSRGQSTLLFAHTFPDVPIVSVEIARDSANEAIAAERLRGFPNVELLFGDSREMLPKLVRPGDVAVLDGPKGYRGLKLALHVLASCRPAALFMHDCHHGSEERDFFDRQLPGNLYSDDPAFEAAHADLDQRCWERAGPTGRPHHFAGKAQKSYAATYACVPYDEHVRYGSIHGKLRVEALLASARRSWRKRFGGS